MTKRKITRLFRAAAKAIDNAEVPRARRYIEIYGPKKREIAELLKKYFGIKSIRE